jgi:integrase
MSITKERSGRLRVQVWDASQGRNVSAAKVLGLPRDQATFPATRQGRRDAQAFREKARQHLAGNAADAVTVAAFRDRWLADPLFHGHWKDGATGPTARHNTERTAEFANVHGRLPLAAVDDRLVAAYLKGGKRTSQVPALRAMFNAAMSAKAGRLVDRNPFAGLGLARTKGNRDRQPPSQQQLEEMIRLAWQITPPSFAGYLEFACCTGIRPGEIDLLEPCDIDHGAREVHVRRQWNAKVGRFTTPKYGPTRSRSWTGRRTCWPGCRASRAMTGTCSRRCGGRITRRPRGRIIGTGSGAPPACRTARCISPAAILRRGSC